MLARVLNGFIGAADLGRWSRATLISLAAYVMACALALIATISALVAAYAGMITAGIPAWGAGLIVSACFAFLALTSYVVARKCRPTALYPSVQSDETDIASTLMAAFEPIVDDAAKVVRDRPVEACVAALIAGIVAGAFRRR